MLEQIDQIIKVIDGAVWGLPLIILILFTGFLLTTRLGLLQIRHLGKALKFMFKNEEDGQGEVTSFGALCTALSATIGTGNITGVATALAAGGPGALFWMVIAAFFGMATKYAEGLLAIKYRTIDKDGHVLGGPFYYIENGMGKNWRWLAKIFAFFGVVTALLGCGTFPQVNAITESVHDSFHIPVIVIGIIVTVLTAVVTLGGIQAISKVAQFVVPFMAISFIGGSMVILIVNHSAIPGAFAEIFSCAFSKESALGGAAGTAVVSFMTAMRTGVARGVYTNEAGLGSSPIVAAAAKTDSCVKQGLISMTSVFFTTILTCSMTGLVVISSGLLDKTDLSGSVLVTKAYNAGLPFNIGMYLVAVGIIFFSFTTILGWNYYGERCVLYLTGKTGSIKIFKIVYILAIATAPFLTLEPIWLGRQVPARR